MQPNVDEIAPRIDRLSAGVPQAATGGFTLNPTLRRLAALAGA